MIDTELYAGKLFKQAPVGVGIFRGADLVVEMANEMFLQLVDRQELDFVGKPLFDSVPETRELMEPLMLQVLKTGVPTYEKEFECILFRNGKAEKAYVNFVHQPLRETDGAITGVLCITAEVTEQVLIRKQVAATQKEYQNLIQSLPVAVYTCDKDGLIQIYNKAAVELWGREPIPGNDRWCGSWKIFKLDGESIPMDQFPPAISIKEGLSMPEQEIYIEQPDGERRYIRPSTQLVFDEHGAITGAINTLIDVTEIRKTQQRLTDQETFFHNNNLESEQLKARQLEEKVQKRTFELHEANKSIRQKNKEVELGKQKLLSEYARSLIEASLDPFITINASGKITDMNEAFAEVTGHTRESLKDTSFGEYFTEPAKALEIHQEVFARGFVKNHPLTINDEALTPVLINGSVYKDDLGNVLGAVVVARVIVEQKRFEKELTEARVFAELATIIAEEAKSKAELATSVAEEAVKAKQQFLSNMSHEIRTPMNAIIGFTKVVLKTELTAKQKEYLTAIKISGDALIVLINDILDLAKVDAGKMTFEQTPFKLALSIAAMLHLFETKIQEKNLKLIQQYDQNIPEVLLGDPVRLHQIILNLVSNAVKFTTKGTITVTVQLVSEDTESATIGFSVRDTGIGIPEEKLGQIFENFQQASSGTSRIYGGTGLGLAIVKQLVEPQGGQITVKSQVDVGSTFSFTLRFQKTNAAAELETELVELNPEIKGVKILVVEDMPLNQLLMKTVLDDFGFERDIAENGKIAIEKLLVKNYDLILMDLQMPEMNGFEATAYIRNTMKLAIPIIALTADVTTVDLEKCRAVGMNDYIPKPIDERLLYTKIVGLFKKPALIDHNNKAATVAARKPRYTDLDYLTQKTKNNAGLIAEMISAYLDQTPPLIHTMKKSLQDQDWEALYAAVHKMIPSFSIMGISQDFEGMAKKVQEYARMQQEAEDIDDLVHQIESVCLQACLELQDELTRLKTLHHG